MSSNIKIERICEHCGALFIAQKTVTKYCSHKCNQRAYKEKLRNEKITSAQTQTKIQIAKPIETIDKKPFLSIGESCALLGLCRKTLYNIINRGDLQVSKIGNRTIVSRANIDALLGKYTLDAVPLTNYYTVEEVEQKYGVKYSRLNEIINERSIPKKLLKNRLHLSKEHIDAYFAEVASKVDNIEQWYSVEQLKVLYGLNRDSVYKLVQKYNIPKKQVGKFVYLSKRHFDELGIVPTQIELEL